jgi:hypothetical protein
MAVNDPNVEEKQVENAIEHSPDSSVHEETAHFAAERGKVATDK